MALESLDRRAQGCHPGRAQFSELGTGECGGGSCRVETNGSGEEGRGKKGKEVFGNCSALWEGL